MDINPPFIKHQKIKIIFHPLFLKKFFIGRLTLGIFAYNRFPITLYLQKNSRHHHKKTNADRPKYGISGMGMATLLFGVSLFSTHHYITAHQAYCRGSGLPLVSLI